MKQIQWFPGHMQKAKREIKEKLPLVDIVYEMLDARVPFSSRNPEVSSIIGNKPKLVLLNKASLSVKDETDRWINYFVSQGERCLAIDSIDLSNVSKIIKMTKEILRDKVNKNLEKGMKKQAFRALIIGIPNSGKSTLINSLAKRKAAVTGDKPGVTKSNLWVKATDELLILDTPGILWPKFEDLRCAMNLALSGAIKDDVLPLDDVAIHGFKYVDKYHHDEFVERYKLKDYTFDDVLTIYDQIALLRGCRKNGKTDYHKVNQIFLNELRSGVFGGVSFDRTSELI